MALSAFTAAIQQLAAEKNLPEEAIIATIEAALAAAYRRDYGESEQVIRVKLLDSDGKEGVSFKVYQVHTIVADEEEHVDPIREITITEARKQNVAYNIDDEILTEMPYHDEFGRIAAQTAKQVIIQRIREAERDILYTEFKEKEQQLLTGQVQQVEFDTVTVSLGRVNGIMPPREQLRGEYYGPGQRLKVFVKEVAEGMRGPQIIVSRADARFILELFRLEVPEIQTGVVEVKAIQREAGSRTKMAVFTDNPSIDPIGSCVGQRGARVQTVLNEIGDEKIDIVLWDEDPETFLRNALAPAKIREVSIDTERRHASVQVDADQLSLAIGRNGQNVRLASKLTGFTIDILRDEVAGESAESPETAEVTTTESAE